MRRLPPVRRLVVKIGSSSLMDPRGGIASRRLAKVVREVASVRDRCACVLVSSGAIATGLVPLGLERRPRDMPGLQAAAAVGQGRLVAAYDRLFARRGLISAQVLLTLDDVIRRRHFVNARNTLERLLAAGVVPVVNENDTVATEEIRFGDNDRLAALVAVMVRADLLVLLSDVDGIYTSDPRRGGARLVEELDAASAVAAGGAGSGVGSGGMASKLDAAGIATAAGVGVVVAGAARRDVLSRVLAGEPLGTWIAPRASRKQARKAWIAFASGVRGSIAVDDGAERAVRENGRSLLAAGITGVEGDFGAGDPVEIRGPGGEAFARGLANYAADEVRAIAGRSRADLVAMPGGPYDREVVHRDELVVVEPWRS